MADENVYQPFDKDVEEHGGYIYASTSQRSAVYANSRFSDITISALSFSGKSVVDVGCGDGTYTAVIAAKSGAKSVLGVDPAAKAIERAKRLYSEKHENIAFRNCLSSELVEKGECFDIAVYRGVIHHVGDPAGEIATAMKLAKNVFFLEPNGWNSVLKVLELISPYHRKHKEKSYITGKYEKWIKSGGGKIDKMFYFGLVPMFCPDWIAAAGAYMEPIVEKIPLVRTMMCGQIGIVASPAEQQ